MCSGFVVKGAGRAVIWHDGMWSMTAHRPLSSFFWGLPYTILNLNHKKELLRGLWVTHMHHGQG